MKKFLTAILSVLLLMATLLTVGCGGGSGDKNKSKLNLYVPDGAPALSVARLLHDRSIVDGVNINVVDATTIQTYVTGEQPRADFAILPVNVAVKLLASKDDYKLLGTVNKVCTTFSNGLIELSSGHVVASRYMPNYIYIL